MSALAPIALFAYNRPRHLVQVVEALAGNPEAANSSLFVYCDAARTHEAAESVTAVRRIAKSIRGFLSVEVVEQVENKGIANSIIYGVGQVTERFGRVIVLEDDLLPSRHFLRFINGALDLYEDDEQVASVHAYSYPVPEQLPETFFLRGADCWGWGTWKRAWALFEPDGRRLLEAIEAQDLADAFDLEGSYPYVQMLQDQIAGRNDSWAIRWYASAFLQDRYTLYPGSSQVQNIGADGSGYHMGRTRAFEHTTWGRPIELRRIPVEESLHARRAFARYLARLRPSLKARLMGRLNRLYSAVWR